MKKEPHRFTTFVFRLVALVQIIMILMPIVTLNVLMIIAIGIWLPYAIVVLFLSLVLLVLARKLKKEEKKVILFSKGLCVFYLLIGYLPIIKLVQALRIKDAPQDALLALGFGIGLGALIVSALFIPCLFDLRKKDPTRRWSQFLSRSALQS